MQIIFGVELAEEICNSVKCAEQIRYVSTGGEADMYAKISVHLLVEVKFLNLKVAIMVCVRRHKWLAQQN